MAVAELLTAEALEGKVCGASGWSREEVVADKGYHSNWQGAVSLGELVASDLYRGTGSGNTQLGRQASSGKSAAVYGKPAAYSGRAR